MPKSKDVLKKDRNMSKKMRNQLERALSMAKARTM